MWPRSARYFTLLVIGIPACWAQFSASIQGTVQDPAGAVVPNAKIQLKNMDTNVVAATASDVEGNFRYVSLAPGSYQVTVDATGFSTTTVAFVLATSQNLNVPVSMKVAGCRTFTETPVSASSSARANVWAARANLARR